VHQRDAAAAAAHEGRYSDALSLKYHNIIICAQAKHAEPQQCKKMYSVSGRDQ